MLVLIDMTLAIDLLFVFRVRNRPACRRRRRRHRGTSNRGQKTVLIITNCGLNLANFGVVLLLVLFFAMPHLWNSSHYVKTAPQKTKNIL